MAIPIHDTLIWPEVPGLDRDQIICLGRCSTPEQFWGMARAFFDGECPLCNPAYRSGEVVKNGKFWYVLQPPGTYNHNASKLERKLVLVPKGPEGHSSKLDLPEEAWIEFGHFMQWMNIEQDQGGMLYLRTGSALFNACTVPGHVHWNYDAASGNDEVRPPIYKDEKSWQKDLDRFAAYHVVYEPGTTLEHYLALYKARQST